MAVMSLDRSESLQRLIDRTEVRLSRAICVSLTFTTVVDGPCWVFAKLMEKFSAIAQTSTQTVMNFILRKL